jgi:DNA-binding MarR family transcriptional regulator
MRADTTSQIIETTFRMGRVLRSTMGTCPHDVHIAQLHAIAFIEAKQGLTMKELAEMLLVTQPSATSFVNRLVGMGLVRRVHDPKNRRLVRLTVTPRGSTLLKKKMAEKREAVGSMLSGLSVPEQEQLLALMQKMIRHCSES